MRGKREDLGGGEERERGAKILVVGRSGHEYSGRRENGARGTGIERVGAHSGILPRQSAAAINLPRQAISTRT